MAVDGIRDSNRQKIYFTIPAVIPGTQSSTELSDQSIDSIRNEAQLTEIMPPPEKRQKACPKNRERVHEDGSVQDQTVEHGAENQQVNEQAPAGKSTEIQSQQAEETVSGSQDVERNMANLFGGEETPEINFDDSISNIG